MPLARYYIKSAENPWKTIPLKKYKKIMFFFSLKHVFTTGKKKKQQNTHYQPTYMHNEVKIIPVI